MEISLKGKVALVTGASRGIGLAIAKTFAESGASVMMVSRKIDESSMEGIDGEVAIRPANVGDPTAAVDVVRETIEKFGRLDILVNNAATNPYYGPTLGVDDGRYEKTFQVNLKAPIQWTQAAYEASFRDKPGVIINIASVGGLRTDGGGLGIYNLTKAALIHYTRQLASEIGPNRVVGIAPGLVKTDFASFLVENFGDQIAKTVPVRRLGEPQDIANFATFLASEAASWITGETYVIDGGAGLSTSNAG
jgi:NAD(P)-dependent dehydrogenase (short-subunit alcohol dehydrogenase family)